jgi:hypothetical protein
MPNQQESEHQTRSENNNQIERRIGLTLALFAAVLAVVDLGGGKFGDDEIIGTNEKANLYQWYQSKSIKQSIVEQEVQLLTGLVEAGAVTAQGQRAITNQLTIAKQAVQRYEREKREILLGSKAVGPKAQVLEVSGLKGQIIGTKPWEQKLDTLGLAGDKFDMATLWLQIALVFGAISLILNSEKLKASFYYALVVGSLIGTGFGIQAFQIASSMPSEQQATMTIKQ